MILVSKSSHLILSDGTCERYRWITPVSPQALPGLQTITGRHRQTKTTPQRQEDHMHCCDDPKNVRTFANLEVPPTSRDASTHAMFMRAAELRGSHPHLLRQRASPGRCAVSYAGGATQRSALPCGRGLGRPTHLDRNDLWPSGRKPHDLRCGRTSRALRLWIGQLWGIVVLQQKHGPP